MRSPFLLVMVLFSVGFFLIQTQPVNAASWWLSGGISASNAVAAYQPKGAASLAASYRNLASPGTNDATPGVAPTWNATDGWIFAGTNYLNTGIVPQTNQTWTMILKYSNVTNGDQTTLAGGFGGLPYVFAIQYQSTNMASFSGNGQTLNSPAMTSGVYAISGRTPYRNGLAESTLIAVSTGGTTPLPITFGALNFSPSPIQFSAYHLQAAAIYNATLTGSQVLAVTNAMNAISTSTPSISSNVNFVPLNSTGYSIPLTLTSSGASWTAGTPGSPTFVLSGGTGASITGQSVTSSTAATIVINAGSTTGNLTITDPGTGATTTVAVVPIADDITSFGFGLAGETDTIGSSTVSVRA